MTDQKKLEIRFLVRTPISYIRRGPFPSLACDSIRGASLTVHTQARPPGPALADAPEAHPLRRLGAARFAVRDEEGDPAEGWGTVELTVLDSSSPKLTDPPEGRLCKL